jgi:glycosyltransferase involved in cell wall biosynthesis
VLFLDGGNLPVFGPDHRKWVERVFSRADLIVAPSGYLAHAFGEWGYDVRVIPNVLEIEAYDYRPRTAAAPNMLWMRTFHEHYNPLMAVRVLSQVVQTHPGARLTMGGADHGMLDATRTEAERLGVAGQASFPGYLRGPDKLAALAAHDIFLNTNDVDNMPVSVLEAAASGLVPVATAVGGIPYLIEDDVSGVVVPPGDPDAMSSSVLELLDDPERFARLSIGARALAQLSGWPMVRDGWIEELSRLVPEWEMQ